MKKNRFVHYLWIMAIAIAICACSDDSTTDKTDSNKGGGGPVDIVMENCSLSGVVKDTGGNPLEGVTVSTGTATKVTTGTDGVYTFNQVRVAEGRALVKFEKTGYFSVVRAAKKSAEMTLEVKMQSKGASGVSTTATFSASDGKEMSVGDMKVEIPSGAIVDKDGNAYTGSVNADVFYLSPENDNFTDLMPGSDLEAVRADNSNTLLLSYGMTEVSLTDANGNPLQLSDDGTSNLTFPIPAGMESNPPATIPLWNFNEDTGLWEEEGIATYDASAKVYKGSVKHFSWHNLDYPAERVTVQGYVKDCQNRPISKIKVTVDQTSAYTSETGFYSVYIPENTPVTVKVHSEDYSYYTPEITASVSATQGGKTVIRDLELPCLPIVSGRVLNSCGSYVMATVWGEYTLNGIKRTSTPKLINIATGIYKFNVPTAATNVKVWAQAPNGTKESKSVNFAGSDVTVDDISLCQETDDGFLLVTKENGDAYAFPLIYSETIFAVLDSTLTVVVSNDYGTLTFTVNDYTDLEGETYSNGEMILGYGDEWTYVSENISVKLLSKDGKDRVMNISSSGGCTTMSGSYTRSSASLTGILSGTINISNTYSYNVNSWSSLLCAQRVPELALPIDMLAMVDYLGIKMEALFYSNLSTYDNICSKLEAAGWIAYSSEETSKTYIKGMDVSIMVMVQKNEEEGFSANDGKNYKVEVLILDYGSGEE